MEQGSIVSQPAIPSPDGALIAAVYQSQLLIRTSSDGQIVESFPLPRVENGPYRHLQWSKPRDETAIYQPLRVLLTGDDAIQVFEVKNPQWKAAINGVTGSLGRIAHVEFGAHADEVVVFSDFGVKATIWSVVTGRGVEIKDPKIGWKTRDYRPKTRHWAILTREAAHDNLMILAPGTHEVLENVELPTVDAQGIKWSPDGRWLAIWDASSAGYRVCVYTADGHLFKTYAGGQTVDNVGLGIKSVRWSPQGRYLALGDYDDRITILATNIFHPKAIYIHTPSIDPHQMGVWEEEIQNSQIRNYRQTNQHPSLPSQASLLGRSESVAGISLMEYNKDGTLLATRSDSTPSSLWIWSMSLQSPLTVLIHHAPIRSIQWHPIIDDLLLIHCALDYPVIYLWRSIWQMPIIQNVHLETTGGRIEACWLPTGTSQQPALLVGNALNYTTVRITMNGEVLPYSNLQQSIDQGPDDRFDGSLIDFSPVKLPYGNSTSEASGDPRDDPDPWNNTDDLEDTFHYRHPARLAVEG